MLGHCKGKNLNLHANKMLEVIFQKTKLQLFALCGPCDKSSLDNKYVHITIPLHKCMI